MIPSFFLTLALCAVPLVMVSGYLLMGFVCLLFLAATIPLTVHGVFLVFEESKLRENHLDGTMENVLYMPEGRTHAEQKSSDRRHQLQKTG